ncbi:FBP domain-containing protein [Actinoplanes sp. TRM 88003]|uniref:FBP domain-containing protein n=1 Tax=Paractinoplanes aksuensis TaxID=2939490 RepID=A0ABT1DZ83_9ACTN|nr:FBP domain-containing protein [Actinoplanes aksuensis]MCO8276167.1 FBP domain-containing protein [Actinoplanes aksuensis]
MKPLTEQEIRAAFVNTSKGEAKRLYVPRDLHKEPWEELDYLGWRDPRAPNRAALVFGDHALILRVPSPGAERMRRSMCSICSTSPQGGVSLMVAPRAGKAGKRGDSIGSYICNDFGCSLYIRGLLDPGPGGRLPETIPVEDKIERLVANLIGFVSRVTAP